MALLNKIISGVKQAANWVGDKAKQAGNWVNEKFDDLGDWWRDTAKPSIQSAVDNVWDDVTGKSNVLLQNELEEQRMARQYEYDKQAKLDSYQLEADALSSAGLNRSLMYSSGAGTTTPTQQAPQLQAYSGDKRIDKVLNHFSTAMNFLLGKYQTEAAAENLMQQRIKTEADKDNLAQQVEDHHFKAQAQGVGTSFFTLQRGLFEGHRKSFDVSTPEFGSQGWFTNAPLYSAYSDQFRNALLADLQLRSGAVESQKSQRRLQNAQAQARIAQNLYDFGVNPDGSHNYSFTPYFYTRNQQAAFNYDLDQDLKKWEKESKIFSPLMPVLMAIIRKRW